ncbi:MAG: hypothetical protein SVO01_00025 [Thermotogota bacterium]|nr:hypothetical protein [Thermotogota bacterium]
MSRQLSDWLEYYMKYTQRTEPPELYHLWSGLAAISSALRRKCYCDWGALRGFIYPNMFISLVGPPGGRKGTAMKIAKSFVQKLEIPIGADSLGSTQALYKELIDSEASFIDPKGITRKHKSLSVWSEEFQVFLSDRDQMLIPALTDLFDCADTWKYKTISRKTDNVSNCWLTIIGAITPDLLQSKLSRDAVGGGLISRIIFVVAQGPKQRKALQFLTEEEQKIYKCLETDLQEIANLSGPFTLNKDFLRTYVRWYENEYDDSGVPSDKFLGYNHRRPLHLNKVCMLVSASESNDMIITDEHFRKALAIMQITEQEMPNAFYGLGLSSQANVYAKILSFIESREFFDWPELVQNFHLDVENITQLRGYLEMAEQSGIITSESSATTCRYNTVQKTKNIRDPSYLEKTVFRLMDRNVIKYIEEG